MKKVINGKMYNTETAKEIGRYSSGNHGDFSRIEETLYRKKNGEFFLLGDGGPMTRYARTCEDGSIGWGEEIIPMTLVEAKKWCERYLSVSKYIKLFGEVEE